MLFGEYGQGQFLVCLSICSLKFYCCFNEIVALNESNTQKAHNAFCCGYTVIIESDSYEHIKVVVRFVTRRLLS